MTDQPAPDHDDLPLPDYDHLSLGTVTHRIRSLDRALLEQVLAYERAHGDRLPVRTVIEQRLEQLDGGAEPSGGDPTADVPQRAPAPDAGSPVGPATQGPAQNPPSHGVPTNPAQPRR